MLKDDFYGSRSISDGYPHLIGNDGFSDLGSYIGDNLSDITAILSCKGAVLFRGYGIDDGDKLSASVSLFPGSSLDYVDGNSPRTKLGNRVYTSTEHPSESFISLHNELSYTSFWPRYIFFCCVQAAEEGGSTLVADSRLILRSLSKTTRAVFRDKGVRYIRNLHGGLGAGPSWQSTFETDDRTVVSSYCSGQGIDYQWSGDNLRLIHTRPATVLHPDTGEEVWFNQADQFHPSTNGEEIYAALMELYSGTPEAMPQYACFGDGSAIPLEMLDEIRQVTRDHTSVFQWEVGDLMVLDNVLMSHGRSPFQGSRKILVSMIS